MAVEEPRMRFTTERYERMVETGVLTPDDRVELIAGEIVEVPPIGPLHSTVVERLARLFHAELRDRASIRVQSPVRLPPDSEPEPDLWLAEPPPERYARRHPEPEDLHLVVEVAQTSQERDREKLRLYARAGIREAWLVDLPARRLEVHRDPTRDGYGRVEVLDHSASASPLAFPDVRVPLAEVIGAEG